MDKNSFDKLNKARVIVKVLYAVTCVLIVFAALAMIISYGIMISEAQTDDEIKIGIIAIVCAVVGSVVALLLNYCAKVFLEIYVDSLFDIKNICIDVDNIDSNAKKNGYEECHCFFLFYAVEGSYLSNETLNDKRLIVTKKMSNAIRFDGIDEAQKFATSRNIVVDNEHWKIIKKDLIVPIE